MGRPRSQEPIPLFRVFVAPTAHAALGPVLASGRLAGGPRVAEFEARLAAWLDVPRCVALNDASGALAIALRLAGVGPGDEVITSPLACAASIMPIANLFATPVWCDIDPSTGMMDPAAMAARISAKTRAILHYHWSGNPGDIAALAAIADRNGLPLIQDASEAFGAEYRGHRLGREADYTVYSFYATKQLCAGEGAALLARRAEDLDQAVLLRRFGIDYRQMRLDNGDLNPEFDIPVAGYNLAMNEMAATLASEALPHADEIVARHVANGEFYESALSAIPGLKLLRQEAGSRSAYWTYSFLAEGRDELIRKLTGAGIGSQRLHLRNDTYTCFGDRAENLPGVSAFEARTVSIPCGWWVSDEDRQRVADCIGEGW